MIRYDQDSQQAIVDKAVDQIREDEDREPDEDELVQVSDILEVVGTALVSIAASLDKLAHPGDDR